MYSFYGFYIPEYKQQLRTVEIIHADEEVLHTLNLGCSFITLKEPI